LGVPRAIRYIPDEKSGDAASIPNAKTAIAIKFCTINKTKKRIDIASIRFF
jgi:hypothetical protein